MYSVAISHCIFGLCIRFKEFSWLLSQTYHAPISSFNSLSTFSSVRSPSLFLSLPLYTKIGQLRSSHQLVIRDLRADFCSATTISTRTRIHPINFFCFFCTKIPTHNEQAGQQHVQFIPHILGPKPRSSLNPHTME